MDLVERIKRWLWEATKILALIVAVSVLVSVLFGPSAPFFGNLATRLRFKDATEWCPTLATDGRYFYYNRNFVAAMSDELSPSP